MKKPTITLLRVGLLLGAPILTLGLSSCEVKKTEEAEMPDVKVESQKMPEYEVEGTEVTVEEKKVDMPDSIKVPDIDVVTPEGAMTPEAEMTPEGETSPEAEMTPEAEPTAAHAE